MNGYIILSMAIATEVIATLSLKWSEGFTHFFPSTLTITFYCISFYCLSLTLKTIPVGIAYAIWSASGMVIIATAGIILFNQKLDLAALIGIALIVAGVMMLSVVSQSAS